MALPADFMQKLHDANDIVDMFQMYTSVKKSGRIYMCCCPFHTEKTPSCAIYPEDQHFYCFGCNVGGDVVTFVELMENLSFMDAVHVLAQRSGLEVPRQNAAEEQTASLRRHCLEINRETAKVYLLNLLKGSDRRGLQYFLSRGLTMETIKKYGLGFAPDDWHQLRDHLRKKGYTDEEMVQAGVCRRNDRSGNVYDYFRNRVIFPIIDLRKNVVAFGGRVLDDSKPKYLNTNDTPVYLKGNNIFSLNFAKDSASTTFILGEGYMDVIAMHQAGFTNAVATLGTALTDAQVRLISRYAKEVVISYDSDGAGQRATQRALNMFNEAGIPVRVLKMEGAKDPDEFIKKFGAERFRLLINHAGDALEYQFEKCRIGLDMETDAGKNQYARRCVKILAGIQNPLQREIYLNSIRRQLDIDKDTLNQQIQREMKYHARQAGRQEFQQIESSLQTVDKLNPQAEHFSRESKAEQQIISYLLHYPEDYDMIWDLIRPEDFLTEFHRHIYEIICQRIHEAEYFDISLLGDDFSREEQNRIYYIFHRWQKEVLTRDLIQEHAHLLRSARQNIRPEQVQSDDDLLRLTKEKAASQKRFS